MIASVTVIRTPNEPGTKSISIGGVKSSSSSSPITVSGMKATMARPNV